MPSLVNRPLQLVSLSNLRPQPPFLLILVQSKLFLNTIKSWQHYGLQPFHKDGFL